MIWFSVSYRDCKSELQRVAGQFDCDRKVSRAAAIFIFSLVHKKKFLLKGTVHPKFTYSENLQTSAAADEKSGEVFFTVSQRNFYFNTQAEDLILNN